MQDTKGFTMLETIVVIIIVSILAVLGINQYLAAREKVLDKEAITNLKIIRVAERSYYMDTGTFYPSLGNASNISLLNSNLKIFLTSRNWNYQVWNTGCSRATRIGSSSKIWYLAVNDADEEPNAGTGCP